MELYFIRHGQSENNLLWATTGGSEGRSEDAELTDVGREQAARVARFLSRGDNDGRNPYTPGDADDDGEISNAWGITHLYCSPMIRTISTGQAIARRLGLSLLAWRDLHEVGGMFLKDPVSGENVGLPGKDRAYLEERYPELVLPDSISKGGWWDRPFEERPERLPRAQRVLQDLLDRHTPSDDRVAWVSHGGFHSYFLAAVLGLPSRDEIWFHLNNVAITRIDFAEDGIALRYVNRVGFLPTELVT